MKKFHVTGNCVQNKHYMADTSEKINTIVTDYIQQGRYFTINEARQYGKTTTLYLLEEKLKEEYIVLNLSFESADEYFKSSLNLVEGLLMDISDSLIQQNVPSEIIEEWNSPVSERFPMRTLGSKISCLCRKSFKEVILMIDEVDKSSDNQIFLSFLSLLREKYQKQLMGKDCTFKSVILAGVYDIKNLKLHPGEEIKNNSPWNIAADFLVDMSFTPKEISSMLRMYEEDHHTGMDISSMSHLLYDYTSGYPYLVSKICQLLDERISNSPICLDKKAAWTKEGVLEAVRILLKEPNTLFDDMIKQLYEYPKLSDMLKNILFQGRRYTYEANTQMTQLGMMFGFLKERNQAVCVSNRIFETKLYNFFLSEEECGYGNQAEPDFVKNQFVVHGMLQMELVMKKFYEYFENVFSDADEKFLEEEGRRIFLMYIRPIINGVGNYYIEAQTRDRTRTDVVVDYKGRQFIIELKLWRGKKYHNDGQVQLAEYLEQYHQDKGYLLTFNFNQHKQTGVTESMCNGKQILEVIV